MATIALRVPTCCPGQPVLPNGQCYILFRSGPITVRQLIAEKVKAELRKFRAGGLLVTALPLLLPDDFQLGTCPRMESRAIESATAMFEEGRYLIICNGKPLVELDEVVTLDRETTITFVYVPEAVQHRRAA